MKSACTLMIIMAVTLIAPSHARMRLAEDTTIVFATVDQARQLLMQRDRFVQSMSPFDRAARLKTDKPVSEKQYLEFVGRNVLAWQAEEEQKLTTAFRGLQAALESLDLSLPQTILAIKTTGREEGGAPYTRANAIVLPQSVLAAPAARLQQLISHELFHILSRANPGLRDELYRAIGFVKCAELPFPPELKPRKLTNPDAPQNDHCIRIGVDGQDHWAIPILYSRTETYDTRRGGEFFNYLEFKLLLVERASDSDTVKPLYEGQQPRLIDAEQASGFYEQIGNNTRYIIHPEEILADNFAFLVLDRRNLPSPEITEKMRGILNTKRSAKPDISTGAAPGATGLEDPPGSLK